MRSLDALRPSPWNPRRISPEALAGLRRSLAAFGDLSGFVVNERTGAVICGHARREALAGLDLSRVEYGPERRVELGRPGKRFTSRERLGHVDLPGGSRFTVRLVRWDPPFEKAANVAANSPALQGEFTEGLSMILEELRASEPELSDDLLFARLGGSAAPEKPAPVDPDAAPPLPAKPRSRPGQVYRMGGHALLVGDATDRRSLVRLGVASSARMVFTDPPYNMDYRSKALGGIANDSLSEAAFIRLILASASVMLASLRRGGSYYICMSGMEFPTVCHQLRKLGVSGRPLVWVKESAGLGMQDYRPQFEVMLYGHTGRRADRVWNAARAEADVWDFSPGAGVVAREEGSGMTLEFGSGVETVQVELARKSKGRIIAFDGTVSDVWRLRRERGSYQHPTQKPVALVERAIANSSRPGDVVFDCFAGSGTTVIACERTGRRCRAIELDPKYADVIVKRWEQFTGREAEVEPETKPRRKR